MFKVAKYRESLEDKIFRVRYTAYNGAVISLHHSLKRERFTVALLLSIVTIPLFFNFLTVYFAEYITGMWESIFRFWLDGSGMSQSTDGTPIGYIEMSLFNKVIAVPYPNLSATVPSSTIWWVGLIASIIIFLISFTFNTSFLPLAYFLRLITVITIITNFYFLAKPDFKYDLSSLVSGNLLLSYKLIILAPWILALTYNIFNFSFLKKLLLSFYVVAYLSIFIPVQYMFHAAFIHNFSLLFLPVLHLILGSFMDIVVFMSIYAWGLSWRKKKPLTSPVKKK